MSKRVGASPSAAYLLWTQRPEATLTDAPGGTLGSDASNGVAASGGGRHSNQQRLDNKVSGVSSWRGYAGSAMLLPSNGRSAMVESRPRALEKSTLTLERALITAASTR